MASREKKQPDERNDSFKAEFVRQFKTRPFIFIGTIFILVIVIVAFVFVPAIVPEAQGMGDFVFGYYNKVPVAYVAGNYFYQELQKLLDEQRSNINEFNYPEVYRDIWQTAFALAVIRQGILDEMKSAGYVTPEDVVDRQIALLPDLQVNGKFSVSRYRQMDKTAQMNLWRQIRDDIAISHYREYLSGLIISAQEGEFIRSMASPGRSFDLASIPVSSYPDSEIVSFVQSSPSLFRVARLSRITVTSSEREARQILDSIKNETTTFEDAAKESRDSYAESGGDMGIKMAYELNSEIPDGEAAVEALLSLPKGSLSDIIKVPEGWTFFRAEDDVRPADTGDLALMEKVRAYVWLYERGRMDEWLLAEANQLAGDIKAKGFDTALYDRGIEKRSFGPLPINYGNVILYPSVYSSGIPESEKASVDDNFWTTAFSTPLLTPSKPLIVGDFVLVLYPTEEIEAEKREIATGETESDELETPLDIENVYESAYSWLISRTIDSRLAGYFFSNGKLEDRFDEVFRRQVLGYN
jgi:hypothetical protein